MGDVFSEHMGSGTEHHEPTTLRELQEWSYPPVPAGPWDLGGWSEGAPAWQDHALSP